MIITSHYYSENPNVKRLSKEIIVNIKDITLKFITDNGIFSKKGLDFGTRTLLENINVEKIKGQVLDLGCGYGPIGIYISKKTGIEVDMIDVNSISLELSKKNALLNQVTVNVMYSDKYEKINKKYDLIITNPPIRIGKKGLYEILFNAKDYLIKGGQLWLVIHKDQGAKSLIKDLKTEYNVSIVEKNKGFYVICAVNN